MAIAVEDLNPIDLLVLKALKVLAGKDDFVEDNTIHIQEKVRELMVDPEAEEEVQRLSRGTIRESIYWLINAGLIRQYRANGHNQWLEIVELNGKNGRKKRSVAYIYQLSGPDNIDPEKTAIYFGKAKSPNVRLRQHRNDKDETVKAEWLQWARRNNVVIVPEVIRIVPPNANWRVIERSLIAKAREQPHLVVKNASHGGEGPD